MKLGLGFSFLGGKVESVGWLVVSHRETKVFCSFGRTGGRRGISTSAKIVSILWFGIFIRVWETTGHGPGI